MARQAKRSPFRQLVLRLTSRSVPRRLLLRSGPRTSRTVSLTFDDGPHPENTPRILDVLKRHGAVATFFVVGERARKHPELVRRIVSGGHDIGGHSYFHRDPASTSARELCDEARKTDEVLRQIVGSSSKLFRPPFGKLSAEKLLRLWLDGRNVALWNRDPKDFAMSDADQLCDWLEANPLRGGDVVLLHDKAGATVEALEEGIRIVRRTGMQFCRISSLFSRKTTLANSERNVFASREQRWLSAPQAPAETVAT